MTTHPPAPTHLLRNAEGRRRTRLRRRPSPLRAATPPRALPAVTARRARPFPA
ncbi:hypothetical protein BN159_p54 (plasmid) [Streptomyces davaonensis JCM 4913]|uniref:Uncharacterized protein n=1 Tax=Streptomyces davaonensis (strain DSM 101723 / JCM 4913 / KCC S-0913 / 768) TaxID=1214101 RepID=K4RGM6_STRDJ|nr:hypothetical protein BN159_p54 [Streptomyces davaonensis JCM 4913]